ncbi:F0F1 ATP synthase subunit delta [Peribacillus butanolivorans]|uniref:ATP synthase subunit delta n=1 Tax=Peribacillus butanolivorans TaxID=421767 RepID=A0AAX0RQY2_9BACI|nr:MULTISPECIES: F0F1 ATP synthase subunit delta [Peribacillus]KRF65190.1 ATP synthase F0F1 subunit delta [Bacillus sp. Soil768D1]AXN38838.1 F0F1 ATP synthase subunit delta [Peribacillus butanolivorans]KON66884.1 ATP synthase F0F1 subunit delta [Peribacillus butanolivorans]MBK5444053.1 F0F1 ATP synthase subunit delta [Peribacillus sp. TH24]MBK5461227.1 F0F1 ATP synthase subunit delta [Peribacillus sp. TH27]
MSDITVAKRYAVALFQIAKEQNLINQLEEELRIVNEVFTNDNELLSFLAHPKMTKDAKSALIANAFASLSSSVQNTVMLMVERHRTDEVTAMAQEFIELANEENSVADATVYTVRPLTESEMEAVSSSFAAKIGKRNLRITNITDTNILGGIKLQIGNRIYDGTISGKLGRLSKQLLG